MTEILTLFRFQPTDFNFSVCKKKVFCLSKYNSPVLFIGKGKRTTENALISHFQM